jgi:hypothetical protein
MENRIKEQFGLFADRVSSETMRANGTSGDDPHAATEDRGPGASQRTESLSGDGGELSVGEAVRAGACPVAGESPAGQLTAQGFNQFFRYFFVKS